MFTLSQGQFDTVLPEGFGFPIMSDEIFSLTAQVVNHNEKNPDFRVRHKVIINYVRDKDTVSPMTPVFTTAAWVVASLDGQTRAYGVDIPDEFQKHASCLPGQHAPQANSAHLYVDKFGHKFTAHWVVPPGKETRSTLVTEYLNIPFDTTIHYIALHLHPFAESLEFKDLTTGETVFKSHIQGPEDRIGITRLDSYTSKKGLKVYKDHEYQLISKYNNTSGVDQDSMAMMFFYMKDIDFVKPGIR
jgi:hypothetical protein